MLILRQSTAIDIRMGPFVDATDGVTPETGITLGAADQAEVLKADGAATVAMGGAFAAVTGADGWYDYTVATGDVDTVGEVVFVVQDSSVALPVFVRGYVVEEAVYDSMYDSASAGPLQSTTAGRTLDVTATGAAGIDWGNIENPTTVVDLSGTDINLVDTCTTNTDMRGTDSAATAANLAIVDTNVDAILVDTADMQPKLGTPAGADMSADIAAVKAETALIVADTNELQTDWTDGGRLDLILDARASQTSVDTVDTNVDAILVDTGTTIPAQITALNDISVSDVLTTQMTEAYAADGTAPTLAQALFLIQQSIGDFSITGTTITVNQLDGTTTAATYTLDDGTSPTSRTRAT